MARKTKTFRDATSARHAYRRASAISVREVEGEWRIEFVGEDGDGWRKKALRLLGLTGLSGTRFRDGQLLHLTGKERKGLDEVHPLLLVEDLSPVDGAPTLGAVAGPGANFLWSQIRGEVRRLDVDTLVGVHLVGPARVTIPLPFVLHRHHAKA